MTLQDIIDQLDLQVLTQHNNYNLTIPQSGYVSDLLSCVMAGAQNGGIWITVQSHANIIAIASLLELSAIIITENAQPEHATIAKANEQDVVLLSSSLPSYIVAGRLWEMGLKNG
jgi:serine kinase of HPr protein (carbohydrate metabolism regulator)